MVSLVGRDVRRFCNGMFTNNVRDLPVGAGQRSAMCDVKGRLLGLLDLYLVGEAEVRVVLEGVTADEFEARYAKYIVFDDVELTRPAVAVVTVQGSATEALLAVGLPIPDRGVAAGGGVEVLRRDRSGEGGFDLLVPSDRRADLIAQLHDHGATIGTLTELERRRVRAGRVRWPEDMPGRVLIAELGLRDEVCSFEKGCYIGQEIIHRLDVMGQIKKRLVGVRVSGPDPVASGAELLVGDDVVGRLTSPTWDDDLGWIGLAVVRMPHDAPGTEVAVATRAAVVVALPFAA